MYGDLIIIDPKPYSIYLRGTIGFSLGFRASLGFGLAFRTFIVGLSILDKEFQRGGDKAELCMHRHCQKAFMKRRQVVFKRKLSAKTSWNRAE